MVLRLDLMLLRASRVFPSEAEFEEPPRPSSMCTAIQARLVEALDAAVVTSVSTLPGCLSQFLCSVERLRHDELHVKARALIIKV